MFCLFQSNRSAHQRRKISGKKDNVTYLEIFESFKERHRAAIEALVTNKDIYDVMMEEFVDSMIRVEDILKGINLLGELSDKTLAQLVSYGERFSSFIVAGALRNADLNGIYVNATKLVRTDSNYLSAKVNFEKTNKNILDFFEAVNGIACVTVSSALTIATTSPHWVAAALITQQLSSAQR